MTDSNLLAPNGQKVTDLQLQRTTIGGTPVDYQADPAVAVQISPAAFGMTGIMLQNGLGGQPLPAFVLTNDQNLPSLLSAQLNINNAVIRELIALRQQVRALLAAAGAQPTPTEQASAPEADDAP